MQTGSRVEGSGLKKPPYDVVFSESVRAWEHEEARKLIQVEGFPEKVEAEQEMTQEPEEETADTE